ncbi:aminopeptidase [Heyndrickxia shackletonii]|uniref:Aminopeptidase n=1 Tax=Heyndrickxia shackletonii TaxID=157838 RepID=A0A0Q3WS86_9BACI|nr:C1 family peptidase [Heyndrickxia shackletonii]KQL51482.1 aminopeptidase [Heyndrickxia shackletonii]NEZ01128.1 C1 family peptidase [Heyndrickxia shackletonii]
MANEISAKMVEKFSEKVNDSLPERIVKNAVIRNGIDAVAENSDAVVAMNHVFSDEIETGKVSNQKQSGRCWMFAALNTFHHKMNREFQLKDFELSQNYINFWDKFEKANYFLESVLETANEPLDGRLVSWILATPQQDGGQWDMFVSLVKKYGVVPKQAMPETFQSSSSMRLNAILNTKLREDAVKLRDLHRKGEAAAALNQAKEEMLSEIYKILTLSLGEPPKTFNFEYRNKEKEFHRDLSITPHQFYEKYIGLNLDDYVSIINAPTQDKPYGKTYTVQFLGNVVEGKQIKYLNVDMETMKELAIKQIQDNESVWFGCDVGKSSNKDHGIMDLDLYDYETTLGIQFSMTKAQRLDYKGSVMTHAMVLTGVNLVEGKPNRWKVENSWGEKVGNKGYFVMSDKWMDEYTYQIVINKKYLSDELKKAWEQDPIPLKPWDPMGSLAK